jgi:hypothetical protein
MSRKLTALAQLASLRESLARRGRERAEAEAKKRAEAERSRARQ